MKKKKLIILLSSLILIIAILVIIFNKKEETNKIVETTEKTAEVTSQSIVTTLTAPGEVRSAQTEKLTLNTSYNFLTMCAETEELIKEGSNLLKYTNGTYITAPYDCVITSYSVPEVNSSCTASNYIEISSVEDLYMEINIGEDKIDKVSENQEVDIIVNYDETKEYKGTITKINAIGTNNKGTTKFSAIASLKNDGNLKLGMSATCTITLEKNENLVCVPIEAIIVEDDKKYVNLIKNNDLVEKVEIQTGVSDANNVQVISGLNLGDKVKYEVQTVTVINNDEESSSNPLTSMFNMGGKGSRNSRGGF